MRELKVINPEKMYLEDVLGIEGFVRPMQGLAETASSALKSTVVAVSDTPLLNGTLELLKKMLASIQIHDFVAIDSSRDIGAKLEGIDPTSVVYLGEAACVWLHEMDVPRVTLPSLTQLTDTSDPVQLQKIKKETWSRLQQFAKEL